MIIIEDLESTNVNKPTDKRIKKCNHQHTFTAHTISNKKHIEKGNEKFSSILSTRLSRSAFQMYHLLGKRERNERKIYDIEILT